MSTIVKVMANHGWSVVVTPIAINGQVVGPKSRVEPNTTREFCAHYGQDLLVHEVQPDELAAEINAQTAPKENVDA